MILTEYEEHVAFIQYLDTRGIPYFHVPNETYTKSWNVKRKNRAMGVKKGVPDIFMLVKGRLASVEMKRLKGGVTSPEQKAWIQMLNDSGIPSRVCKGCDAAIAFVTELENN